MNQKFFDLLLLRKSWNIFSIIATVVGLLLGFTGSVEGDNKAIMAIMISVFFITIFIIIYLFEFFFNKYFIKEIKAQIGKVYLTIKVSDLFEEEGLKVIPVNEYFDTQVDDKIISSKTLHGMFIKKYVGNDDCRIKKLNSEINKQLKDIEYENVPERRYGKRKKYPIGTSILIDDFILTALSKFNEENKAYLSMPEYLEFLNKFWNEVNRIHNGRIVNVPVMGTGLARINPTLSYQEFLEQIIFSLRTSSIITGETKINIIISSGKKQECSLSNLKNILNTINNK